MKKRNVIKIFHLFLVITLFVPIINLGEILYRSTYIETTIKVNQEIDREEQQDSIYSNKKLGSYIKDNQTHFALFAPNADNVSLILFEKPENDEGQEYSMVKDQDGVWELVINENLNGKYYGYEVYHDQDLNSNKTVPLCVDPYAKAVTTFTTYMNPRKSIIFEKEYDWEGDEWIQQDWRDLIIYEMHIRDMTAHKSADSKSPGTYKGLVEKNIKGGINYIKELGVNTVELLPAMEFGNCEIPYKDSLKGKFNSWNIYERNHWGYMTSNFFAPEAYYSENWNEFKWDTWMGQSGDQVKQFKDMVKAFHKEGIAVIMDVVYKHLSEYEIGNLKQIDRDYYFRLDDKNNFIAQSGCGNDLKTEHPMMRRMIIESVLFWMKEYHIDGFRFDLGKLIDWETIEDIIYEAKKINPNVVFVCEPWGGGYDPEGFSLRGWGAWNDQIRNGIKGENPFNGFGWIFGEWYGNNNPKRIKSYVNGTLVKDSLGLFHKKEHSVNYLESHDGYTLGDFIRIGTKEIDNEEKINSISDIIKLSPRQMKLNKLGALFLFTSQGVTMIHSGQEYARSKVIPLNIEENDEHKGRIDHNTYNKDNETNYINYEHVEINRELFDYYRGLIELRKTFPAFRRAEYKSVKFFPRTKSNFAIGYSVKHDNEEFIVLMNADQNNDELFALPEGNWEILVNSENAGITGLGLVQKNITIDPVSGVVLRKR